MQYFLSIVLLISSAVSGLKVLTSCGANRKLVALTFDDGPSIEGGITQRVLEKLNGLGIKATFFTSPAAMGEDEKELTGRCELIKKLSQAGMQIGIHNWKHEKTTGLTNGELGKNIDHVMRWMTDCGAKPPTQYRPPYGILSENHAKMINGKGLAIAMWNVEPNDGEKRKSGQAIFEAGFKDFQENVGIGNSAIWSLHDSMFTKESVNDFFPAVVKKYQELGYEFVTMDKCYEKCGQEQCDDNGGPKPDANIFHPRKVQ